MKYRINLIPPREQNIADKAIYFSFNYLRYILVITQIIVIGVFFYRFKVDQEIVDLKDALTQKQEIVSIASPLIDEVHAVERSTKYIGTLTDQQDILKQKLAYIVSVFPDRLKLDKLSINGAGDISMTGVTDNPRVVSLFYERLKKDKKFSNVSVGNVKKELFNFTFSISLSN